MNETLEGFRNYRSPFESDTRRATHAHQQWADLRGTYEITGNVKYLNQMLTFVTMNDPPLAPPPARNRTKPAVMTSTATSHAQSVAAYRRRCWFTFASLVSVAFLIAGIFGGFAAITALVVILGSVFALSARILCIRRD